MDATARPTAHLLLLSVLVLAGCHCAIDRGRHVQVDGGRVDGGRVDGGRVDGGRVDGGRGDGGRGDGGPLDGDSGVDGGGLIGAPVLTPGCDPTQRAQLLAVVGVLRAATVPPGRVEFSRCVRDAITVDHDYRMPEDALAFLSAPEPLTLRCVPPTCPAGSRLCCAEGVPACFTWADGDPYTLRVVTTTLSPLPNPPTPAQADALAGSLAYLLMYGAGFHHPHPVNHSVPNAVSQCFSRGRTFGWSRSDHGDRVALPHLGGGGGGTMHSGSCARDEVAIGVVGTFDGTSVSRFDGLVCQDEAGGPPRVPSSPPPASGSSAFDLRCPSGHALVGVTGEADVFVRALQPICATLTNLLGDGADVSGFGPRVGTIASPDEYERVCPAGKVVMGYRIGQGVLLDRLQLFCDEYQSRATRPAVPLTALGSVGGAPFEPRSCEGNARITGLFGSLDPLGRLDTIGGYCSPLVGDALLARQNVSVFDNRLHPIGDLETGSVVFRGDEACPDGQAMVGIQASMVGAIVGAVTPRCAEPAAWIAGGPSLPATTLASVDEDQECPRGTFVSGFQGYAGAVVDQLQLVCMESSPGLPTRTVAGVAPGPGGSPFRERCSGSGPLTGLRLAEDETGLTAVGTVCGHAMGATVHVMEGYVGPDLYGGMGDVTETRCPAGQVLRGLTGYAQGGVIRSAAVVCQPASAAHSTGGGLTTGPFVGIDVGIPFFETCPDGQVAHGVAGRFGGLLYELQLECAPADLVPGDMVTDTLEAGEAHYYRVGLVANVTDLTAHLDTLSGGPGTDLDVSIRVGGLPTDTRFDPGVTETVGAYESVRLPGVSAHDAYYVRVVAASGAGSYRLRITGS